MNEDPFEIFGSDSGPDYQLPPPDDSVPRGGLGDNVPVASKVIYQIEESRILRGGNGKSYQAVCPELLITAFGDTEEDARDGLRQQVADYLEDCDNLGVLDETLIEAGFYFDDDVWMSSEVRPVDGPDILIL